MHRDQLQVRVKIHVLKQKIREKSPKNHTKLHMTTLATRLKCLGVDIHSRWHSKLLEKIMVEVTVLLEKCCGHEIWAGG